LFIGRQENLLGKIMPRINLISGPRNISTALMYSFAQRSDTVVLDEPFYAVYLLKTDAAHPGKDEVISSLPSTEAEVRKMIEGQQAKTVFIKNMAHHMEVLETPFVEGAIDVFLIRNPYDIIASYSKVIQKPVMRDIGLEYQYQLFKQLVSEGKQPVVIDSGRVTENPEGVLSSLCQRCGIRFEQRMLHWPAGPKQYDGVWATHWYANVHRSTGFEKRTPRRQPLPEELQPLYEKALFLYEKLLPFSLKA
jgi:hypothetical protein